MIVWLIAPKPRMRVALTEMGAACLRDQWHVHDARAGMIGTIMKIPNGINGGPCIEVHLPHLSRPYRCFGFYHQRRWFDRRGWLMTAQEVVPVRKPKKLTKRTKPTDVLRALLHAKDTLRHLDQEQYHRQKAHAMQIARYLVRSR